jgi:hypothetical protein
MCEATTLKNLKRFVWQIRVVALPLLTLNCLVCLSPLAMAAGDPATVTFSLDFPTSDPERYSISVDSGGHAKYECSVKISADSEERESYQTHFTLSEATRARIFDLAAQAHYFSGKIDSGNKKLAFTGAKKLTYKDGQHDTTADYNYSPQPVVQQLTTLFQGMAATLEFGRRIAHYHRYQKLALDEELKRMENDARNGNLTEIQAAQSVLQEVYDDQSVMNVVRARAQRIIELGKSEGVKR